MEAERSEGSEMTFRGGHLRQQPKTCLDKILNLRRKKSLEKAHTPCEADSGKGPDYNDAIRHRGLNW